MNHNISPRKLAGALFIGLLLFVSQGLKAQDNQSITQVFVVSTTLTPGQVQQIDSLLTAKEGIIDVEPGNKAGSFKVTYQSTIQQIRILDKFNQAGYKAYFRDDQGNKMKVGPDGTLQKVNE